MPAEQFYVGLMSGTSMDGIDAVLADLSWKQPRLISHHQHTYSADLRKQLVVLSQPGENEIDRLGEADIQVAEAFAEATLSLLRKSSVSADDIKAIGSHGQTLRHRPEFKHPFTLRSVTPAPWLNAQVSPPWRTSVGVTWPPVVRAPHWRRLSIKRYSSILSLTGSS